MSTAADLAQGIHPIARTPEEWNLVLAAKGEKAFRAGQVFKWIHVRGVVDPAEMTDLRASLRAVLAADGLGPTAAAAEIRQSLDGTRKILVKMGDGAAVESVLIPGVTGPRPPEMLDADAAAADDEDEVGRVMADEVGAVVRARRPPARRSEFRGGFEGRGDRKPALLPGDA